MKLALDRILAAALLLFPAFATAPGNRPSQPPPPRFVPIQSDVHVIAIWDAANPREPNRPVRLDAGAAGETTLVSKTAGAATIAPDGIMHYSISVTDATTATQTFHLTDTVPAGLTYVNGSATGGFVYNPASASLTTTQVLSAFQGAVITTTGAPPYQEIFGLALAQNLCQYYMPCKDKDLTLAGVPFRYLGVDYNTITLNSNGFVVPGSADTRPGNQNQHLPDPATPNNVIAPFWGNLKLTGNNNNYSPGGDWYFVVEQDSGTGALYLVVEWHNAQKMGDMSTSYSFQVWIQLHAEHITFAYDALSGDSSAATIGFENSNGTLGASYLYNGAGSVPVSGTVLAITAIFHTALLGYDVQAQHDVSGCSVITNTVFLSNGPGTLSATAAAGTAFPGLCQFLPVINR